MGRDEELMIEEEQQGFILSNKYVWLKHFKDRGLRNFVKSNAKNRQINCSYCNSIYNTIHLSNLLFFLYII